MSALHSKIGKNFQECPEDSVSSLLMLGALVTQQERGGQRWCMAWGMRARLVVAAVSIRQFIELNEIIIYVLAFELWNWSRSRSTRSWPLHEIGAKGSFEEERTRHGKQWMDASSNR